MFHKIDKLASVCYDLNGDYATFFMEGGEEPDFRKHRKNIQRELDALREEEKEASMIEDSDHCEICGGEYIGHNIVTFENGDWIVACDECYLKY